MKKNTLCIEKIRLSLLLLLVTSYFLGSLDQVLITASPLYAATGKTGSKNKNGKKKKSSVHDFGGQWSILKKFDNADANKYKLLFFQKGNSVRVLIAVDLGGTHPVVIYESVKSVKITKNAVSSQPVLEIDYVAIAEADPSKTSPAFAVPNTSDIDNFGHGGSMKIELETNRAFLFATVDPNFEGKTFFMDAVVEKIEATRVAAKLTKPGKGKKSRSVKAGSNVTLSLSLQNRGPGSIPEDTIVVVVSLPDEVEQSSIQVKKDSPQECTTNTADPDLIGQIQCIPTFVKPSKPWKRKISFTVPEAFAGKALRAAAAVSVIGTETVFVKTQNDQILPGEFDAISSQVSIKVKKGKKKKEKETEEEPIGTECPKTITDFGGEKQQLTNNQSFDFTDRKLLSCEYSGQFKPSISVTYYVIAPTFPVAGCGSPLTAPKSDYGSQTKILRVTIPFNSMKNAESLAKKIIAAFEPLAVDCQM